MSTEALPRHRQLGLTDWESERIPELLGREPTDPELVMFSLMWSEHCSYKHSKPLLGAFPSEGPHILQGPGENAGAIDVGDGMAVAFKSRATTTPARLSRSRARPPVSAASCATSSRWVRDRSPCWTRCGSES